MDGILTPRIHFEKALHEAERLKRLGRLAMKTTMEAIFEEGVFKLVKPSELLESGRVQIYRRMPLRSDGGSGTSQD